MTEKGKCFGDFLFFGITGLQEKHKIRRWCKKRGCTRGFTKSVRC
ncbi:hypothetical protein HMPREF2533_01416 [Bacteroides fragilis]|nr:hypothetical protein HMPREF2530_01416 [Bacteroides fragilis]KXU47984.1 hypothetical protein HMPREF2533_01416 [Bacteroides fragilis]DAX03404.1 MAG TPA: hypothetical protein [Bacteriophage sp.]